MELLVVGYIHIQVFNKRKSGAMHSFHRIEMIFQQIENMNWNHKRLLKKYPNAFFVENSKIGNFSGKT